MSIKIKHNIKSSLFSMVKPHGDSILNVVLHIALFYIFIALFFWLPLYAYTLVQVSRMKGVFLFIGPFFIF